MKKVLLVLLLFLVGCSTPLKPSEEPFKRDPLIVLNCPDLHSIDSTQEFNMGDLVVLLVQVSNQYYLCQQSALQNLPKPKSALE